MCWQLLQVIKKKRNIVFHRDFRLIGINKTTSNNEWIYLTLWDKGWETRSKSIELYISYTPWIVITITS